MDGAAEPASSTRLPRWAPFAGLRLLSDRSPQLGTSLHGKNVGELVVHRSLLGVGLADATKLGVSRSVAIWHVPDLEPQFLRLSA